MAKCVIFCAAEFDSLAQPLEKEDMIIAADGGLRHLQELGVTPNVILGDFDSLGYIPEGANVFPVEKDDTDAMLAIRHGLKLGFQQFIIYGGMGGSRPDHTVANLQALQYLAEHGARGYLVCKDHLVTAMKEETIVFPPSAEGILSVFCMGSDAEGVTLEGLKYSLTAGALTSSFPLGASNHFTGQTASVTVKKGCVLLFWERKNGFPSAIPCDHSYKEVL